MPIFEEKLICPFSVRFTQEHIRPVFQDGRHEFEETIAAIGSRPGQGDYDVILSAPFPNIELIRWHQQDHRREGVKLWFTLDNRRLYCLQRAAVALWPKRCAAVVEVLYAATEGVWRKDNSCTAGKSVSIGHSLKQLTGRWDWRESLPVTDGADLTTVRHMDALIMADEKRSCVKELMDAPAPPSMLDRFLAGEDVDVTPPPPPAPVAARRVGYDAMSTITPSSPRSTGCSDESAGVLGAEAGFPAVAAILNGLWCGEKGEIYDLVPAAGPKATSIDCTRTETGTGTRRFTLWYDKDTDAVWWGNSWNLYLEAAQARRGHPGQLCWYTDRADGRQKLRFIWQRFVGQASAASPTPKGTVVDTSAAAPAAAAEADDAAGAAPAANYRKGPKQWTSRGGRQVAFQ